MAATGPGSLAPVNTIGQVLRVNVTCYSTPSTQLGLMVHYYSVAAVTGTGSTLGACLTTLNSVLAIAVKDCLNANATFRGLQGWIIEPPPTSAPAYEASSAGPGTVLGDGLPLQVSGVIGIYTAFAGREWRGRKYMPFAGEADNAAGGGPLPAYVTRLQHLADQMLLTTPVGAANGVTLVPVLRHPSTRLTTAITAMTARPFWGTQRRRGMFGRSNAPPPF